MWAITKKELKNYFLSPIGYVYIGIFLMACSLFFYLDIFQYLETDFSYMFGSSVTVLTFIVPLLTMRMFAEERKNGTEQLLLTSPKSITQIVLGKFLAAVIVVLISSLLTLMHFAILSYFGEPDIATSLLAILGFSFAFNCLCIIWNVCIKYYRKPNNISSYINWIFLIAMVFTRSSNKYVRFFINECILWLIYEWNNIYCRYSIINIIYINVYNIYNYYNSKKKVC